MNARYTTLLAAIVAALPLTLPAATPPAADNGSTPVPANPFALPAGGQPAAAGPAPAMPMAPQSTPSLPNEVPTAGAFPVNSAPATAPTPSATPVATTPATPDPIPGDTYAKVIEVMGRPNGQVGLPDGGYLLMFDRGHVILSTAKVVTEVSLQPLERFQAARNEEIQQQAEAESNRIHANALLDMLLTDPTFRGLTTRDRLLALEKFNREHPGSNAPQDIKDLQSIYQAELVVQNHIADLADQTRQAQSQLETYQKKLAAEDKIIADLRQRTEQAEEKTAEANVQQQINQSQTSSQGIPQTGQIIIQGNNLPNQGQYTLRNGVTVTPPPNPVVPAGNPMLIEGKPATMATIRALLPNMPTDGGVYQQLPNGTYQRLSPPPAK